MIKKLWNKIDGYKTISGIVVTGIGGLMLLNPLIAIYAKEMIISGITITIGGLGHKAIKYKSKLKE